jgi:hypothetical protein
VSSTSQPNPLLSSRAARVIRQLLASEDHELVHSGREWWIDNDRVSGPACLDLLRLCLVRTVYDGGRDYEIYELSSETERMLSDPAYVPAIITAQQTGKPVML